MNKEQTLEALRKWQQAHNLCAERDVRRVDARGALDARLPALALLLAIIAECEGRVGISGQEMIAQLTPLAQLLAGDTRERLRRLMGEPGLDLPVFCATATDPKCLWG